MSVSSPASPASSSPALRRLRRTVAVIFVAGLALALVGAGVAGGARLARPTAVAVVDVNQVLSNLDQQKARSDEIQAMRRSLQQEGDALVAEFQAMVQAAREREAGLTEADLDEATRSSLLAGREALRRKELEIEAFRQRSERRLDWERSYALEDLVRAINDEIGRVAEAGGYDIVLSDDSGLKIAADRRQANAEGQIASHVRQRRVLFAVRGVDITQDVINRMNNAWKAGG